MPQSKGQRALANACRGHVVRAWRLTRGNGAVAEPMVMMLARKLVAVLDEDEREQLSKGTPPEWFAEEIPRCVAEVQEVGSCTPRRPASPPPAEAPPLPAAECPPPTATTRRGSRQHPASRGCDRYAAAHREELDHIVEEASELPGNEELSRKALRRKCLWRP